MFYDTWHRWLEMDQLGWAWLDYWEGNDGHWSKYIEETPYATLDVMRIVQADIFLEDLQI